MLLSDALSEFVKYQIYKNNSKTTIANYTLIINKFIEYTGNCNCSDLSADDFNNYNIFMRSSVNSVSVRTYIRHLKVFLSFLVEHNYIIDFRSDVIMPQKTKKVIEILSPVEIKKLLSVDDITTFLGLRNHCMLLLMLDCGLRAAEVVTLTPTALHLQDRYIVVSGKGDKQRIVPTGDVLTDFLLKYICNYGYGNSFVFRGIRYDTLTTDVFKKMFKHYKNVTNIERLHPHLLRHTFATNFLLNGFGDVYELSMLLGHSDIKTTEIYLHIANYYKFMFRKKSVSFLDTLDF